LVRFSSPLLSGVLTGSFDHFWSADLVYDGQPRLGSIPLSGSSFGEDGSATVQQSGSCTIVWTDDFGRSMSPREVSDAFTPFGAQLRVYSNVTAGPFLERAQYGVFEITDVPSAHDDDMQFRGQWITTGSRIELDLKELTAGVGEETFDVPSAPADLASTWDEAARVTGLQILRTITDVPISRSILYPDSKLDATYDLFELMLDAVPHMTADGVLSARPNSWPAPVRTLTPGDGGQLISVGHSMSAALYNRVVVRATGDDQSSILAIAEITDGPLRVRNADGSRSPFRARTKYLSSEYVTTAGQAQTWADSTLLQVSTQRSRVLPVEMTFDPLLERGDVVRIERPRETMVGRILTIDRSNRGSQSLTVEVAS
jgi:hypothetical protein